MRKALKYGRFFSDILNMKIKVFCAFLFFSLLTFSVTAQQKTHIVENGETLYSLARKYNVSVSDLAKINDFSAETKIKTGQKLVIPIKDADSQKESKTNMQMTPAPPHLLQTHSKINTYTYSMR